jgi:hypothetical protein
MCTRPQPERQKLDDLIKSVIVDVERWQEVNTDRAAVPASQTNALLPIRTAAEHGIPAELINCPGGGRGRLVLKDDALAADYWRKLGGGPSSKLKYTWDIGGI